MWDNYIVRQRHLKNCIWDEKEWEAIAWQPIVGMQRTFIVFLYPHSMSLFCTTPPPSLHIGLMGMSIIVLCPSLVRGWPPILTKLVESAFSGKYFSGRQEERNLLKLIHSGVWIWRDFLFVSVAYISRTALIPEYLDTWVLRLFFDFVNFSIFFQ